MDSWRTCSVGIKHVIMTLTNTSTNNQKNEESLQMLDTNSTFTMLIIHADFVTYLPKES
jgi:hypothetical protein